MDKTTQSTSRFFFFFRRTKYSKGPLRVVKTDGRKEVETLRIRQVKIKIRVIIEIPCLDRIFSKDGPPKTLKCPRPEEVWKVWSDFPRGDESGRLTLSVLAKSMRRF